MSKDNKRLRTFVKHFVNPLLRNFALASRGPFALLRHVGRRSGKTYEIPIMVWRVEDGFVIVLTYGPQVDWLRNLQAAAQGSLRWHKQEYVFQKPEFIDAKTALPALPPLIKQLLRLRGVHEFVKLSSQPVA
jgi:deazaflavin-dependent oxidoreductase (nitroreductase family)